MHGVIYHAATLVANQLGMSVDDIVTAVEMFERKRGKKIRQDSAEFAGTLLIVAARIQEQGYNIEVDTLSAGLSTKELSERAEPVDPRKIDQISKDEVMHDMREELNELINEGFINPICRDLWLEQKTYDEVAQKYAYSIKKIRNLEQQQIEIMKVLNERD